MRYKLGMNVLLECEADADDLDTAVERICNAPMFEGGNVLNKGDVKITLIDVLHVEE